MSFAEKVHNRLLALEGQVKALDQRLKALEPQPRLYSVVEPPRLVEALKTDPAAPIKRKPGRPKKVVNG